MNYKNISLVIIVISIIIVSIFAINKKEEKIITQNIETNSWQLETKTIAQTWIIVSNSEIKETNTWVIIKKDEELTQEEKEEIDKYNFEQLELVKSNLSNFQKWDFTIRNYIDYNRKYDPDIKHIRNCYYVSTENWKEPFIFWFKLESDKYKEIYGLWYYVYPKYEIQKDELCFWLWEWSWCIDKNYTNFMSIISDNCRWVISWYIYEDRNENWLKDESETWIKWWVILDYNELTKTDNDWYYSFSNVSEWRLEIKFLDFPLGYRILWNTNIRTIYIKNWEILENINYWVYKTVYKR